MVILRNWRYSSLCHGKNKPINRHNNTILGMGLHGMWTKTRSNNNTTRSCSC
uniref:Uncharacterized protein n=1 Tax=Arundo donax TaxID=35708 RepID=A0A0A9AW06_ARUDO